MKSKLLNLIIFILSMISLIISIKLFWNIGIYVDEYNTNPNIITSGDFWTYMAWLQLGFNSLICILSGITLFKDE